MPNERIPEIPAIRLQSTGELDGRAEGFLRVIRRRYLAHYPSGQTSEPFVYDEVGRRALDAAVIAAHFRTSEGVRHVYLRSAVRPPVASRSAFATHEAPHTGSLWELPAGLVEPDENRPGGAPQTARRELHEELGFEVDVDRVRALGPSTFPTPGVLAERHFFFEVEVDPTRRGEPVLDGSALEVGAAIVDLPVGEALELCRRGIIEDSKTELGLRRLAELDR